MSNVTDYARFGAPEVSVVCSIWKPKIIPPRGRTGFFGVELIIQLPLSDAPLSWIGAAQLDEATGHENANNNCCLDTCASK